MRYSLGKTSAGVEFILVPVADFVVLHDLAALTEDVSEVERDVVSKAAQTCAALTSDSHLSAGGKK